MIAPSPAPLQNATRNIAATLRFLEAWANDDITAVVRELENGANPDCTLDGVPLLVVASRVGNEGLVSALLQAGANANARSAEDGRTALHYAALRGASDRHQRIISRLVEAGADLNSEAPATDHMPRQTPIEAAVGSGAISAAQLLKDRGALCDHRLAESLRAFSVQAPGQLR